MAKNPRIMNAELDWDAPDNHKGAPRSIFFDDIYFSGDGLAETEHVFLGGNDLPARWKTAVRFSIGELGFGTGLNFLAAWYCRRRADKPDGARLDFFSVEGFPLARADLERAHEAWPELRALSNRLLAAWPPPHPGFHRIEIDECVTLTLFFGDALAGLSQAEGAMDAWFLDGFSPAKNPDMWSTELLSEVGRLSRRGTTFATFTVAGDVRRALQAAGFEIEKRPGYGRKREMLAGTRTAQGPAPSKRNPWFQSRKDLTVKPGARIAIIGAGIAGASLAYALRRQDFAPTVFETNAPASGASGNPGGLIMPRLDVDDTPAGRFHASAYLYTIDLLRRLERADVFNPCGVAQWAPTEKERERQHKLLERNALPDGWIEARGHGLFFPQSGVVHPPSFVQALLGDTPLRNAVVTRLHKENAAWRIDGGDGSSDAFDAVIIANGLDALRFAQTRSLPLTGSAGQIDFFPDAKPPDHAVAFGPYAAPAPNFSDSGVGLIIGATYAPIAIGEEPSFAREATETNIKAVAAALPDLAAKLSPDMSQPRASIRCVTPDRMPVAGPLPDWGYYSGAYDALRAGRRKDYSPGQMQEGLFILSDLGSRGLVTAPLAAAMMAAEIAGAPAPIDTAVAEALHPARFFIRDLKRGQRSTH